MDGLEDEMIACEERNLRRQVLDLRAKLEAAERRIAELESENFELRTHEEHHG